MPYTYLAYNSKGDIAPLDCLRSLSVGRGKCGRYALRTRKEAEVVDREGKMSLVHLRSCEYREI